MLTVDFALSTPQRIFLMQQDGLNLSLVWGVRDSHFLLSTHNPMDPPQYLYRVFDEESFCQFDKQNGFIAGVARSLNRYKIRYYVERHMEWGNRIPTPFISVTASRSKALQYALQRVDMSRGHVCIAKISTHLLRAAQVQTHHMATLVAEIQARIEPAARNKWEFLCINQIPARAVVAVLTLNEPEEDEEEYSSE
jgi:hypothetical protein